MIKEVAKPIAVLGALMFAIPALADFEVGGRKYNQENVWSFKNVPLGITLKDFKKLGFPGEAVDSIIQLSTDRDFVTPAPVGYQYPDEDGNWIVAIFKRKNNLNTVVTTTIANVVVTPIFAFKRSKSSDYRLVKFSLLGTESRTSQSATTVVGSALTEKYGQCKQIESGSGAIRVWKKDNSTITLQTYPRSFRVTYALSGFEPYQVDDAPITKPSDDL